MKTSDACSGGMTPLRVGVGAGVVGQGGWSMGEELSGSGGGNGM